MGNNNYQPIENVVVVRPGLRENEIELSGGVKLEVVTDFNPGKWAIIKGEVLSVPKRITSNTYGERYDNDIELEVGDTVYFHHNMIREHQKLEEGVYWMYYEAIYCYIRKGEMKMVGDHVFVDAEMQQASDITSASGIILQTSVKAKYLLGSVSHIGRAKRGQRWMWENEYVGQVIREGSRVAYTPESDVPIKVEGREYYRMKFEDLMADIIDGEMYPLGDFVFVKTTERPKEINGIVVPETAEWIPDTGEVLKVGLGCEELRVGDFVWFPKGTGVPFTWEGETFTVFKEDMILCKKAG